MKKRTLLITAAILMALNQLLLASVCAPYDPYAPCGCSGSWYVAGSGAVVWRNDSDFSFRIVNPFDVDSDYKVGGGGAVSVGYIFDLCNYWDIRLEVEGVWRKNDLEDTTFSLQGVAVSLGDTGYMQDSAVMGNFIVDAPLGCGFWLYLGGGIGASRNELKIGNIGPLIIKGKNSKTLFASQFLAGLSYNISRHIALTAGYRLFGTQKRHVAPGIEFRRVSLTNSIDIGLRFRF